MTWTYDEAYEAGLKLAREVQEGLAKGKTFEEMQAWPPERAAEVRDVYKEHNNEMYPVLKAYVASWD